MLYRRGSGEATRQTEPPPHSKEKDETHGRRSPQTAPNDGEAKEVLIQEFPKKVEKKRAKQIGIKRAPDENAANDMPHAYMTDMQEDSIVFGGEKKRKALIREA